jgi:hypothetical protein
MGLNPGGLIETSVDAGMTVCLSVALKPLLCPIASVPFRFAVWLLAESMFLLLASLLKFAETCGCITSALKTPVAGICLETMYGGALIRGCDPE